MSTHVFSLCLPPCPNVSPTWSSTLFPSQARAVSRLRPLEKPWNLASQWSSSCLPQPPVVSHNPPDVVYHLSYICLPDVFDLSSTCCVRVVSQLSSDVISSSCPPLVSQLSPRCGLPIVSQMWSPDCLPSVFHLPPHNAKLSLRGGPLIIPNCFELLSTRLPVASQMWSSNCLPTVSLEFDTVTAVGLQSWLNITMYVGRVICFQDICW